jgi:hypothetical protein
MLGDYKSLRTTLMPVHGAALLLGLAGCGDSQTQTTAADETSSTQDSSGSDEHQEETGGDELPSQRTVAIFWGAPIGSNVGTVWSLRVDPVEVVPLGQLLNRGAGFLPQPVLSPDKTTVAFVEGGSTQDFVRVVPSDGSGIATDVTPPQQPGNWGLDYPFVETLEWTHDSAEILVMWDGDDYARNLFWTGSFWRVEVDGGTAELIASDAFGIGASMGPLVRHYAGRGDGNLHGYFLEYYDLDTGESLSVQDWSVGYHLADPAGSSSAARHIANSYAGGQIGPRVYDLLPAGATQPFHFDIAISDWSGSWSPEGDRHLARDIWSRYYVFNVSGEIEFEAQGNGLRWSNDGRYLAGVDAGGVVFIADTQTWSVTSLGIQADGGLAVDWGSEGVLFSNRAVPSDQLHYLSADGLDQVRSDGLHDADIDEDGLGYVYGADALLGGDEIVSVRAGQATVLWTGAPITKTVHVVGNGMDGHVLVRSYGAHGDELTLLDRETGERTSISADLGVRVAGLTPIR